MKIRIRTSEPNILVRDLFTLFEDHAKSTIIDADHGIMVVEDPDRQLIDELDNRGIRYEILEE